MSLLLRAAIVGGIAYWITRSLSSPSRPRKSAGAEGSSAPVDELHPGENNVWPSSDQQPAAASAGPSS